MGWKGFSSSCIDCPFSEATYYSPSSVMCYIKTSLGYSTSLYAVHNEAHVAYLRKQLENESMDVYVTHIKDLKEQLANINELIPNANCSFAHYSKDFNNHFKFLPLHFVWLLKGILICMLLMRLSLLLQEEQSRVNRNTLIEETSFYYTKG